MAGTVTQSVVHSRIRDLNIWVVSIAWTATSGGAASAAINAQIMGGEGGGAPGGGIGGSYLFKVRRLFGAQAPSASYTVTLTDSDGVDLLGGVCSANGSANTVVDNVPKQDSTGSIFGPVYLDATSLTINISGAGSGGQGTIKLFCSAQN